MSNHLNSLPLFSTRPLGSGAATKGTAPTASAQATQTTNTGQASASPGASGKPSGLNSLKALAKQAKNYEEEQDNTTQDDGLIEVKGKIVRLIFKAKDTNYKVYAVKPHKAEEFTIACDTNLEAVKGDEIVAKGNWTTYKGRKTFRAVLFQYHIEKGAKGVYKWLTSGAVKGVGKTRALALANYFGDQLEHAIKDLEFLKQAPVPEAVAIAVHKTFMENHLTAEITMFLSKHGFGPKVVSRIIDLYGVSAREVVERNPWQLCRAIKGVGFMTADALALSLGKDRQSKERVLAGFHHILNEKAPLEGHCGLPPDLLVKETARLLGLNEDVVEPHYDAFIGSHAGIEDRSVNLVYSPTYYNAEEEIAEMVVSLVAGEDRQHLLPHEAEDAIDNAARDLDVPMDESQREAAIMALRSGLSVITGGAGSGKSTTQRVIAHALGYFNKDLAFAAPTGRAAKRLHEVSGVEASTFHRLLAFSPMDGGFTYNADNPMDEDWFVGDETSMMDCKLGASFLQAIKSEACLTVVGDINQLDSVGAGKVLKDLIDSGVVPVSYLTGTHRQKDGNGIVTAARRVLDGLVPIEEGEHLPGFEFHAFDDQDDMAAKLRDIVGKDLPSTGVDPLRDVQVLAAMKRSTVGVENLNKIIKKQMNPVRDDNQTVTIRDRSFTVGDRVMQLKNDYIKSVFNGEVGTVSWAGKRKNKIGKEEAIVRVDYSDFEVEYNQEDIIDLEQAWAATVHKSQGCEFPVVIFLCPDEHQRMLNRNLLYTALTRAMERCIVIGSSNALSRAVRTTDSLMRYTGLAERIRQKHLQFTQETERLPAP